MKPNPGTEGEPHDTFIALTDGSVHDVDVPTSTNGVNSQALNKVRYSTRCPKHARPSNRF